MQLELRKYRTLLNQIRDDEIAQENILVQTPVGPYMFIREL